jgi:hypothetical protein
LGGALSLYLGISIALFFEFLEFFFDLIKNILSYYIRGKLPGELDFLYKTKASFYKFPLLHLFSWILAKKANSEEEKINFCELRKVSELLKHPEIQRLLDELAKPSDKFNHA